MKNLITLICILFITHINGQTKRGLFLHGYGSDGEAWENTGTPSTLINEGVFDFVETPDLPSLGNLDLIGYIINPLLENTENDDWIFIGHSLGGLMAKQLEVLTRDGESNYLTDLNNLKGVLTLGSPFQGAPVADVEGNNAQYIIDKFRDDIRDGPDWQIDYGWLALTGTEIMISVSGWLGNPLYIDFSNKLDDVHSTLSNYIDTAIGENENTNANNFIGVDGTFTGVLNQIQTITPYLSISGVESYPASVRFASSLDDVVGNYVENEESAVELYDNVFGAYSTAEYHHLSQREAHIQSSLFYGVACGWFSAICINLAAFHAAQAIVHNNGYQKWKNGRLSLQRIDLIWADLHNTELVQVSGTREVPFWQDCGTGSPPGGWGDNFSIDDLELLFHLEQCSDPDVLENGGFWSTRTVEYTTFVADKSDGFIPVHRTRWNDSDGLVPQGNTNSNGASVVSGNIYFDGHDEDDGGYNHSELRNLTRNYGQHGISRPMYFGKQWIVARLGQQP